MKKNWVDQKGKGGPSSPKYRCRGTDAYRIQRMMRHPAGWGITQTAQKDVIQYEFGMMTSGQMATACNLS